VGKTAIVEGLAPKRIISAEYRRGLKNKQDCRDRPGSESLSGAKYRAVEFEKR
jgi:ATP-dependent Clp protease ATP-binding subunit ClpA